MNDRLKLSDVRLAARLDRSYRLARFRAALRGLRSGALWPVAWQAIAITVPIGFRWVVAALLAVSAFAPPDRKVWKFVPMEVFALVLLMHVARGVGVKELDAKPFDALRMPSRAALVLGRILRHGVFLAGAGAALAAFTVVRLGMVPGVGDVLAVRAFVVPPDRTGGEAWGTVLVVAMFLVPLAFAVRAAASAVTERAGLHADGTRIPALIAGFAAASVPVAALWMVSGSFPFGAASVLSFFVWMDVFERIEPVRPWRSAGRICGDVLWAVAAITLLFGPPEVLGVLGGTGRLAAAAFALAWPIGSVPGWIAAIRENARRIDAKTPSPHESARTVSGGPAPDRTYGPMPPVVRVAPGRGFWWAQRERRAIDDVIGEREEAAARAPADERPRSGAADVESAVGAAPPPGRPRAATLDLILWFVPASPRAVRVRDRGAGAVYRLLLYGTGPVFAALAASALEDGGTKPTSAILYAMCAAVLARRAADTDPSPRIHLLGVDWREQVRVNLRCFLGTAALPVFLAAVAVAAWRGFSAPALTGVAAVGALLVLRAGWAGIVGVDAGRVAWGCLALFAGVVAMPFVRVPIESVPAVLAGIAAVGLAGVVRLLCMGEATLAARMRD